MLKLRCFGSVGVVDDDGNERSLRSRKHVGLLLYLVSHPRSVHSREDLSELLWNGDGPRERHSLSQALYDIRSNVDPVLGLSSTSVRLLPDRIEYEAESFERAVESGDHETALDLYRAEFAPALTNLGADSFDRWVDAERERHRVLASLALRNAQRSAEERGDWDRMCLAALRLIRMNEFDEEAHCALMRGLWLKGDPASALRHYRSVDPDLAVGWTAVHALVGQMENSGAVKEVLTVPRQPVDLIGREREFAELTRLYREHHDRGGVILVTGERGVGKTALLGEFARVVEARGGLVRWSRGPLSDLTVTADPGASRSLVIIDQNDPITLESTAPPHRGSMLILTGRDAVAAARLVDSGFANAALELRRLSEKEAGKLVYQLDASIESGHRKSIARLSGGNPSLAVALMCSWNRGLPAHTHRYTDDEVADRLIECSPMLRGLVATWKAELTPDELRVASRIAILSEEGKAFAVRTIKDARGRSAFRALLEHGWLRQREDGVEMSIPVLGAVLRRDLGLDSEVKSHLEAAAALRDGTTSERFGAAAELLAGGADSDAVALAEDVARRALAEGNTMLATKAALFAVRKVESVRDRHRTGLLSAAAEMSRGRVQIAEEILRRTSDLVASPTARAEIQLGIARAVARTGDWHRAMRELLVADSISAAKDDGRLSVMARLQLAEVNLGIAVASDTSPDGVAETAAVRLEERISEAAPLATSDPGPWLDAFRSLFLFRAVSTSRKSAADTLNRFAATLNSGGSALSVISLMGRTVVEARAGRLRTAKKLCESLLELLSSSPDRTKAAAINNMGVILTELGDFSGAEAAFSELRQLDDTLCPTPCDRIYADLNLAQVSWFESRLDHAALLCSRTVTQARLCDQPQIEAEALALLGLVALEKADTRQASDIMEQLTSVTGHVERAQDQYLIGWFRAAFQHAQGSDPTEELWEVAERIRSVDSLAASKLCIITARYGTSDSTKLVAAAKDERRLRVEGAGWFVRKLAKRRPMGV